HVKSREERAALLGRLGRHGEQEKELGAVESMLVGNADPCDVAELLTIKGWGLLLAGAPREPIRRPTASEDPGQILERALAIHRSECRRRPEREAHLVVNLALAAVQSGNAPEARRRLAEARALR